MSKPIVRELRRCVIKPVLKMMSVATNEKMDSHAAENLLLGTAAVESEFIYLKQKGGGPAVSIYQLEPRTVTWLAEWAELAHLEQTMIDLGLHGDMPTMEQLQGNVYLATFFARLRYWVVPAPLPPSNDKVAMSIYWKTHYNTKFGKGRREKFVRAYEDFVE